MNTPKEEFESLVTHPGWLRLKQWAVTRWRDQIDEQIRSAVDNPNDTEALAKMRQVIVAKDAVERLLKYPDEQIQGTQPAFTTTTIGGRGGYSR